jgi:hypothetical protein
MKEVIVDGIPVLIKERERPPRTIRIRLKKKRFKDMPLSDLSQRPKQALKNYVELGCDPKKKKEAAEGAGYLPGHGASVRAMDRILERREIVNKIEEKCKEKHQKGADEKVAEVLVEQLDAIHPLAKGEMTDNLAVLSAAKEINKINDNYPSKKIDIREVGFHLHFTSSDIEAGKQFKAITEADETT